MSKLETIADNNFNVAAMVGPFSDRVENIVGKGENAGDQHLLLFPQYFQWASFTGKDGIKPNTKQCRVLM